MNEVITSISMLAVLIGVTGIVPQLVTMLRNRSSTGQSKLGWSLAFTANFALAFVNAFGNHAPVLAIGNVLSFSGALTAMCLVWRFPAEPGPEAAVEAAPVDALVTDMHTGEFAALRDAVIAEHQRRTGDPRLVAA
ncbi:MAG TPA: hypothetical protein VNV17_24310 [Solirubrobacteraceae bacterium]|jgi:hypothetical protein|nr:hypothetical protein [Solirubrobacteraceae bacterium]